MAQQQKLPRPIEYRGLRLKDIDQIAVLDEANFPLKGDAPDGWSLRATLTGACQANLAALSGLVIAVAVRGHEVVGYVYGGRLPESERSIIFDHLFVKEQYRRQNVGATLVDAFERQATATGYLLTVANISESAAGLLINAGWQVSESGESIGWADPPSQFAWNEASPQDTPTMAVVKHFLREYAPLCLLGTEAGYPRTASKALQPEAPITWHYTDAITIEGMPRSSDAGIISYLKQDRHQVKELHFSTLLGHADMLSAYLGAEWFIEALFNSTLRGSEIVKKQTAMRYWMDHSKAVTVAPGHEPIIGA